MSLTAYPTLRLKLTMPQALKLQFLPAIPGSNAAASADRAEQAAQDAQNAANTAVAATANKVDKSGDVMTGFLTLNADPTAVLHAATKQYVDAHSGSGGGGAPLGAEYITSTTDATLTAERVLTDTASITWDRTTPGQIKASTAAGGGNVSNSGTPTSGQLGQWVTATTIAGISQVSLSQLPSIATDSLLGRDTAATGAVENITLNATLSMNGSGALQRAALTGDVTVPVGSNATTIANDAVTYAKMQNTAAASVLLGRGSAAGAGDPQEITLGTNLSMSGATLNATGGGTSTSTAPQGRLTLQAATPVMITTQAAQTTIRYAPYVGSMLPIYDGTNMVMTAFTELSIATTDTTKSPAAIGASKVNDWFVWNDAGTLRLGHGVDWTNDTTPVGSGSRPGLTMVNGIWTNQAAITNGPAINRGTYVGTTRSNASSSLDFIFGTRAANGGQSIVGVWNCYNRVLIHMVVQDTTASWTYSAAAWNFFNGSATWSVLFVAGLAEDPAMARCIGLGQASATGYPLVAPSFDNSVTALPAAYPASLYSTQIVSATGPYVGEGALNSIGYHNCSAVSYSTGGTVTFIGNNYASLIFDWRC